MPQPPQRRPRWPWVVACSGVLVGVLVGTLGVLFGLGVFHSGSSPAATSTFTMTGFIHVTGGFGTSISLDGSGGCTGSGGYSDMNQGTAVTVANSTGQTLATGELGAGEMQNGACLFPITVPGVPSGLSQYSVTVSHRGTQVIPASEATTSVELSLGN
jgi:hypothetical protein